MPGNSNLDNDLDPTKIAAEIGAELYGEDPDNGLDNEDFSSTPPAGGEKTLGETVPPENPLETTPAIPAFKALPKSWKKDMAPIWEKSDPALHEYVYQREADIMRGIQQYSDGYSNWNSVVSPFDSVFKQHPNVKPAEVFQRLMQTHLGLMSAPLEQRKQMALAILSDYGIDLGQPSGESSPTLPSVPPQIEAALRSAFQEINGLKENLSRKDKETYEAGVAEQHKTVTAFSSDPKNKYFDEVAGDVLRFLQTGAANDLASAYELACYANPAVRAKLAQEQALTATPQAPVKKFPNIEETPGAKPRRQQAPASIDSTIDAIVAKYNVQH